jgi:hypothetical protein
MAAATNPLSYNAYIQQMAALAVVTAAETGGVWAFSDAALATTTPGMLNYSELRIQRDLDMLAAQTSNLYTLTQGQSVFALPVDDFLTVQSLAVLQQANGVTVSESPLLPVSREFIQNCYSGASNAGAPEYFAMIGDTFGDGGDTNTNILFGPPPNYGYTIRVSGLARAPSLYKYAQSGPADSTYTYISAYYPDMLIMASMIYITMYQRNFGPASDDPQMGMTYEKQYQALRLGALPEEQRRKQQGSSWTAYSTPVSATPTR